MDTYWKFNEQRSERKTPPWSGVLKARLKMGFGYSDTVPERSNVFDFVEHVAFNWPLMCGPEREVMFRCFQF
jgi:hypothetical protein